MEFWLSFNNNAEKLRLPVLPPSYEILSKNLNNRVNINEVGNINLIGKSDLKEVSINSFFPKQHYYFVEYNNFPSPFECVEMIEKWRLSGKPIRFIITDTNVNLAMAIEKFTFGEKDGTGDIFYSLEMSEYVFLDIKKNVSNHGFTKEGIRPAKEIPKTYQVKVNDNPVVISKKTTGNTLNARKISKMKCKNKELQLW